MKDDKIKSLIDDYLKGSSLPNNISLDNAKNLIEEKKRKEKQRKKFAIAFASFACAFVIVLSSILIANSLRVKYYDVAELTEQYSTYAMLKNDSQYSKYITNFETIENATNANADYFTYYSGNTLVLMKVEVSAITAYGAEKATIYIEFTDDKHTSLQFKDYYKLEKDGKLYGNEYKYETEQVAGEWVTSAYFEYLEVKYFIDIESPQTDALGKYLKLIF